MAIYDLTRERINYDMLQDGDIINVPYSGAVQQLELPPGQYKLEVWGAQGTSSLQYRDYNPYPHQWYSNKEGGRGGYSQGVLTLSAYTRLFCYSGESHNCVNEDNSSIPPNEVRGRTFGEGGTGAPDGNYRPGGSGGGASDIRIGEDSLYARVIVAGGGSGTNVYASNGGAYGGGLESGCAYYSSGGSAQSLIARLQATQTKAGENASFGSGANCTSTVNALGGSGGGWYGGGWISSGESGRSYYSVYNAGGSGYVYTSATAVNYPAGCLLDSRYYLTSAETIAGNQSFPSPYGGNETGHQGYGYCRITIIKVNTHGKYFARNEHVKKLVNIEVTIPPTKLVYEDGEIFDPTGVVLTITLDDNSTLEINPLFNTADMPELHTGDTSVRLNYTYRGYAIPFDQDIAVS